MSAPATKRYRISEFLTDEQKRRACAATYAPVRNKRWTHLYPRTERGECPLGVALGDLSPLPSTVARHIVGEHTARYYRAYRAACAFENDWDAGRIDDLAVALGITGE